ncbi:hypothetical protein M431DRAFT_285833 [Trichoderma harzianum CBS 226.95]|uniref:Uncharacterized protein n=1 Tax=Trichoderma harzianum CBS 226.95 TaxID=983964 RepID=A0A2T4ANW8_TRIHA|nr:hypothetical protein M431DRAFT_285833 [Trichoderma harzianum CBS 226.95]PTB58775.1 hypothetical protein M431DRAFT_285833 [Trichoderma harzianum CBS 226.95]
MEPPLDPVRPDSSSQRGHSRKQVSKGARLCSVSPPKLCCRRFAFPKPRLQYGVFGVHVISAGLPLVSRRVCIPFFSLSPLSVHKALCHPHSPSGRHMSVTGFFFVLGFPPAQATCNPIAALL